MDIVQMKEQFKDILREEEKIEEHEEKIIEIRQKQEKLGIPAEIDKPKKEKAKKKMRWSVFWLSFFAIVVLPIIAYISPLRYVILQFLSSLLYEATDFLENFWGPYAVEELNELISGLISTFDSDPMMTIGVYLVFIAPIGLLACIIISSAIIPNIEKAVKQSKLNKKYKADCKKYDDLLEADKNRVEAELLEKDALEEDIKKEEEKRQRAIEKVKKLYEESCIKPAYRFKEAVACFYEYFDAEKTMSLTFDPATGDVGAYNLFDEEIFRRTMYSALSALDEGVHFTVEALDFVYDELDMMHNSMSRYYNQSLAYQKATLDTAKKTLETARRTEALTAITAYEAYRTRRNTDAMRRNSNRLRERVTGDLHLGGNFWLR